MPHPRWPPLEASAFWGTVAASLARPMLACLPRQCADPLLGLCPVGAVGKGHGDCGKVPAASPGASSRPAWTLGLVLRFCLECWWLVCQHVDIWGFCPWA